MKTIVTRHAVRIYPDTEGARFVGKFGETFCLDLAMMCDLEEDAKNIRRAFNQAMEISGNKEVYSTVVTAQLTYEVIS